MKSVSKHHVPQPLVVALLQLFLVNVHGHDRWATEGSSTVAVDTAHTTLRRNTVQGPLEDNPKLLCIHFHIHLVLVAVSS